MNITDRQIMNIAIPSIVSNITVPLLGLIDVTIVGHLGAASYIGAIAIGGMLFNMIYWIFGFLRMGTSGLTAQGYGSADTTQYTATLQRSLIISAILSLAMIILQYPIRHLAFLFIEASTEVQTYATTYFHICIWGAPAVLGLYSFTGWFIGMQNSRYPMYIAITQNIINIVASLIFVYFFHMKVAGIAWGTVIAQYSGLIMATIFYLRHYHKHAASLGMHILMERKALRRFFTVNRDIFLRTVCLVSVTVFFTSTGAAYGDVILAVNTLLMQMFTIFSYIMDGFAYAGEALSGKNIGARDYKALHHTIRHLFGWGINMSLLFTILYGLGGEGFLSLLTNDATVIASSSNYFYWVLAIPLAGFMAFLYDGICIGATATRIMLQSMIVAVASFFMLYYSFHHLMGNHALWMGFIVYLAMRGIMQMILSRKLLQP